MMFILVISTTTPNGYSPEIKLYNFKTNEESIEKMYLEIFNRVLTQLAYNDINLVFDGEYNFCNTKDIPEHVKDEFKSEYNKYIVNHDISNDSFFEQTLDSKDSITIQTVHCSIECETTFHISLIE